MDSFNKLQLLNKTCHNFKGIVFSSDLIFNNILKYGITPAEFLRPFFILNQKIKLKLSMKEKIIDEFNITLLDKLDYSPINRDLFDKQVRDIIKENAPSSDQLFVTNQWTNRQSVNQMIEANNTPWFHKCIQPTADFSSHSYHLNFLDQPVVIIYVVSGLENDVIKEIQKIKSENDTQLKAMFPYNQQDIEQIKKFILVLNDQNDNPQFIQEERLRKQFHNHICKVLPFNTSNSILSTIWTKTIRKRINIPGEQQNQAIQILDEQTLKTYKQQFEEFLQYQILTWLERTINIMIQQNIELRKRPISDTFFNFLKRDQQKQEVDYQMSQREYFLRYLADMHFMLQEFEGASEYYRSLIGEIKNNKTKTLLAQLNSQEYYAYSRLCSDIPQGKFSKKEKDEIFLILEEVQNGYISDKQITFVFRVLYYYFYSINIYQRYIKESIFFMQRTNKFLKDIGNLQKPDHFLVFGTVIFEQIAFLFLRLDPPQYRRFAQNLTIVASRYEESFKKNSLRCYRIAESVYKLSGWSGILAWLYSHQGIKYIECEKIVDGYDSFKSAFNTISNRQTIENHNQLILDWKKAYSVLECNPMVQKQKQILTQHSQIQLNLPQIKGPIDIITNDELIYQINTNIFTKLPSLQHTQKKKLNDQNSDLWQKISLGSNNYYEENLLKSMDSNFLEEKIQIFNKTPLIINETNQTDFYEKYKKYGRQSFANEEILLKIPMQGNLKVPFQISWIQIQYDFLTVQNIENEQDLLDLESISPLPKSSKQVILQKAQIDNQQDISFNFEKPQIESINVSIKPHQPGILTVWGIQWNILDLKTFYHINYDLKDQKKRSVNFFNRFIINPQAPQLQVKIDGNLNQEIYYGEIKPFQIKIKNIGNKAIEQIQIYPVKPHHFGFFRYELSDFLAPQEEKLIQFFIRSSYLENFTAKLLIKYKVDDQIFRYQRMIFPMKTKSSFKINLQSIQDIDIWRFILIVQDYLREQDNNLISLQLKKILCINSQWKNLQNSDVFLQQSDKEQYLFGSFQLIKQPLDQKIDQNFYQSKIQKFISQENDKCSINIKNQGFFSDTYIDQQIIEKTLYDFVNEDIHHYFTKFFQVENFEPNFEFPLFLVVLWTLSFQNTSKQIIGMHEIPFNPQQNLLSRKTASHKDLPINFQLINTPKLKHNFNKMPFIEVPVIIKLQNTKIRNDIKIKIEFINGDEPLRNVNDIHDPSFLWIGQASIHLDLKCNQTVILNQSICFLSKGTFDINRLKITVYSYQKADTNKKIDVHEYYSADYEQILLTIE